MNLLLDAKNIALLMTALLNFVLAVLIYFNGKGYKVNKVYAWNVFAIILWIVAMFFYRSATQEYSLFWCIVLYITPTLIASSFLYFTYIFPSQIEKNVRFKKYLIVTITLFVISLISVPSLIIKEVNIVSGKEKEIIFSPFYVIYVLYILSFFLYGFFRLLKKYYEILNKKSKTCKIQRIQIGSLFFGYAVAANLAFVTNLIMPWMGYFYLNWLGQVFTIFMVGFTAYAIFRYNLFQVKLVVSQFLVVVFTILLIFNVFLATGAFEYVWKSILLIVFIIFGKTLIETVVQEIEAEGQLSEYANKLKKANTRLRQLDRQKTEFMSFAAHQLRAPLTSVQGFASLIMEGAFGKTTKKVKGAANTIYEASKSMSKSVDDYLNISRIEQGRMEYDMVKFDLYELAREVTEELKPTAFKKGLKLKISSDKYKKYPVKADQGKTKQIINNFLDNAVKYTKEGKVEVYVSKQKNGKIRVAISDSGIGMSQKTINKLFRRYSRAEDTQGISGTGLGLFIAKKMVEAQKGRVWAESPGEGQGSTFYIEFPKAGK